MLAWSLQMEECSYFPVMVELRMSKSLLSAVVLSLGLMLGASGAARAAEAKQDFVLVNKTGYGISEVYVSPAKSDDWEEDVLGRDTLSDGEAWKIHFSRAAKTCKWDVKVVYEDDDSHAIWPAVDLCSVSKITIHYNRKSDTTSADFE